MSVDSSSPQATQQPYGTDLVSFFLVYFLFLTLVLVVSHVHSAKCKHFFLAFVALLAYSSTYLYLRYLCGPHVFVCSLFGSSLSVVIYVSSIFSGLAYNFLFVVIFPIECPVIIIDFFIGVITFNAIYIYALAL